MVWSGGYGDKSCKCNPVRISSCCNMYKNCNTLFYATSSYDVGHKENNNDFTTERVDIAPGYSITVWDENNFKGNKATFTQSGCLEDMSRGMDGKFKTNWGNAVRSFKVAKV